MAAFLSIWSPGRNVECWLLKPTVGICAILHSIVRYGQSVGCRQHVVGLAVLSCQVTV